MHRSTTRFIWTALALCAVAVVLPVAASARPDDRDQGVVTATRISSTLDPAYLRALRIRGEALNAKYAEDPSTRALRLRGEALNKLYGGGPSSIAVRPDDRSGIRSVDGSSAAVATICGSGFDYASPEAFQAGQGPSGPNCASSPVHVNATGFDWSDAGIGALGALGLSLLAAGGMLLTLHVVHQRRDRIAAL